MILRDVAEAVSMHESTISRVTTGKYMHTPRGIFEFRYFFSSHVSGADGEDVSSVAIRARIRRLIADEKSRKAPERRATRRDPGEGRRQGRAAHGGEVPRVARARLFERAPPRDVPRERLTGNRTGLRHGSWPAGSNRSRETVQLESSDRRRAPCPMPAAGAVAIRLLRSRRRGRCECNLSGHHVDLTPALRNYTQKKLAASCGIARN